MADFNEAIIPLLKHEGGYSNDPNDAGGATNFGISLRYLLKEGGLVTHPEFDLNHDGHLDFEDIKALTRELAIEVYRTEWWDEYKYGSIQNQSLANKILDMSVNMGPPRAHKIVQKALNFCGRVMAIDGVFGPMTLQAVNCSDPDGLLHIIRQQQAAFYRAIVASNPKQAKWLKGWLRRAEL